MLKKTTLAVLGLAASGLTFAGSMGPVCTPGNVTVPCEAKQWSFGVDALYLKVVNSGAQAYGTTTTTGAYAQLNNDWNWGFRASGAYQFSTGNDATVTWLHYSNTTKQTGLYGISPIQRFSNYTLTNQNRIDQANAVLGQLVDVTAIDKIRFYAGMQYAGIQQNQTDYYTITTATHYDNKDFKGFGPVIGLDYAYYVSPQISLIANGATSLLYGTTRVSTGNVLASTVVFSPVYASKKIVTPSFEAKLGLNYAYSLAQGVLNIQGGYQVVDYFSALQASTASNISAVDYALYGPYIGLKYSGNA
jgi:hypothetical protein